MTSSNTVAGNLGAGSGCSPWVVSRVVGITKSYTTRVGSGPMPTELNDETGDYLRKQGAEFGATTGRPRRCGWLDLALVRDSVRLNGITEIALTKLDVLGGLENIYVCTGYLYNGKKIQYPPQEENGLAHVQPLYESLRGWDEDLSRCRSWEELPAVVQQYIERIEAILEVPVTIIAVGPDREQTIFRDARS